MSARPSGRALRLAEPFPRKQEKEPESPERRGIRKETEREVYRMRSGGILMHLTSLPSPGGIGDLGKEAYAFADFLQASGMKIWQVLPVGPTGYGESPYQSTSAFAGNPLLISLPLLREQGLLDYRDEEIFTPADPERVDYDAVRKNKTELLRRAFRQSREKTRAEAKAFRKENAWVSDFALFSAVKSHFGEKMWSSWPDRGIRNRRLLSRLKYSRMLKDETDFHVFCQMLFTRQWLALKKYCNDRGILLFGDMPIYVAEDSADTWTFPKVFQLDRNRIPERVAGVPPDGFTEDGQMWGNPLYRWDYLKKKNYFWWVDRMKSMARLYDMVRIDHFIGFGHYYSIPYGAPNARNGKWVDGPGRPLFETLRKAVPGIRIVAEDLGEVNDQVLDLMEWTGYPGMKVMCFAFDGDASNPHYPGHYKENMVLYTGTHDNDTVLGWVKRAKPKEAAFAGETLGFKTPEEAPAAFVKGVFSSIADTAVAQMQDILGLDNDARMNLPGTIGGNWVWRMKPGAATPEIAARLMKLNRETGRA